MDLNPRSAAGALVLTPSGRIDHATADAFQGALEQHLPQCRAGESALVLDMSQVNYISSVGLRALMVASQHAQSQHGRIMLAALTPMVKEVFEIARFDLVFELFDSVEAALAAAGGAA